MKTGITLLIASSMALVLAGCSNDECIENKNTRPIAETRNYYAPDQKVTLDSILVYGAGGPPQNAIVDSTKSFSTFHLPFDLDSDTTRVVFRYMQKELRRLDLRDTLTLIYSRTPFFVSSACGVSYRFLIQDFRHTRFLLDSVAVPAALVSNIKETNILLFFPVATGSEQQPEEPENPENPEDQNPDENPEDENPEEGTDPEEGGEQ